MATKKELKPHIDYLDDCLELLTSKISEAKRYLYDVKWQDLPETEDREKEFKFQATLVDKYVAWLNEYSKLSGMVDALNEMNNTDDKEIRKGSYKSAFAEMIKDGDFE